MRQNIIYYILPQSLFFVLLHKVSNVFASSRMVGNAEVAPVDTVAPDAPSDTLATGTPIQPQAGVEDSTQQDSIQQQATEQQATE